MLSNLASYIFGSADDSADNNGDQIDTQGRQNETDDWVVVGGDAQPSLNLGSLSEVGPRPHTGSTGSSATPSEADNEDMVIVDPSAGDDGQQQRALTRTGRKLANPLACQNGISVGQIKALKSSQKAKQKDKAGAAKATSRHNMAVKVRNHQHNKRNKATNLAIRASGVNKQLKQC